MQHAPAAGTCRPGQLAYTTVLHCSIVVVFQLIRRVAPPLVRETTGRLACCQF